MAFRFFTGLTFSQLRDFPEDAMISLATMPATKRGYHRAASSESAALAGVLGLSSDGLRRVDGAGFSQIFIHGHWTWTAEEHNQRMMTAMRGLGRIDGAFTQDWMCEKDILIGTAEAKRRGRGDFRWGPIGTGLTVEEHQWRTVQSGVDLERINPTFDWIHTVQGYTFEEYCRCIQMYRDAGIDLQQRKIVAFGSMCKRQGKDAPALAARLWREIGLGPRKHVLGFNIQGATILCGLLTPEQWAEADLDSASWSKTAKDGAILMPGHKHISKKLECARGYGPAEWERLWRGDRFDGERWPNCANCTVFALHERKRILDRIEKRWYWNASIPRGSAVNALGATLPEASI